MNIYQMLLKDEGKRNTLYKDTLNYLTVGVGHLVTKSSNKNETISILDIKFGRDTNGTLTDKEVEQLFNEDIQRTIQDIQRSSLSKLYNSLDPIRQMALLNFCFQLGIAGASTFTNSIKLLQAKEWEQAAINLQQSKWFSQTPNRAARVIEVFRTGNLNSYK
ncbi:glycoside hydrolase family protein [Yersinia enterocolitica]